MLEGCPFRSVLRRFSLLLNFNACEKALHVGVIRRGELQLKIIMSCRTRFTNGPKFGMNICCSPICCKKNVIILGKKTKAIIVHYCLQVYSPIFINIHSHYDLILVVILISEGWIFESSALIPSRGTIPLDAPQENRCNNRV